MGGMDIWFVLMLFNSTRGEVKGFVGDQSWPCPASRAAVAWLAWVSDIVLGMDGRTAQQPVLNVSFWSRYRISLRMGGELVRTGGGTSPVMNWSGHLFVFVVLRL